MKYLAIALVVCTGLAGCASLPDSRMSYVSKGISPADASVLANDAADHLSDPLPPAKTTLVLDPPKMQQNNVLTPAFLSALRAKGYGVVEASRHPAKNAPKPDGVRLRYLASPLDAGILLRLQYQGTEAARFYPRASNGALVEAAPFTVREAGQ